MREGITVPKNENQTLYLFPPPRRQFPGDFLGHHLSGQCQAAVGTGQLSPLEGVRGGM